MSNLLFVLLDGAEDDPCPQLDGRKPIDVAEMPFLESRVTHRCRTTGRGYTQLFLNEFFTGHPPEIERAALEAMGLGLRLEDPRRVAYRLSPARLEDGMVRWSYHNSEFKDELERCIMSHMDILEANDPDIKFFVEGRSVLTMVSDDVPVTPAPPVDAPIVEIGGPLGLLIREVADDMGGITVYPWGCGRMGRQYPGFPGIRNMTAFSDSPTSLGICASLGYGIELIYDLEERFPAAREALDRGDVFLHVDEVDEYSHQKDPFKKKAVLELTDRLMAEYFSDADRIIYFADHGTSCVTGEHILTDVPVWTTFDIGAREGSVVPLDGLVPSITDHR
ncbi:MAG: phosphoglycerate mutase [Thermoplasmata archaeon]|nr:phosphoglycerate mutase [Thermoplasmata archaeon]